jgi:hypothetical protein
MKDCLEENLNIIGSMTFTFKHPSKYKKLSTGAPPKSGPTPQGLNVDYNTVKTVKLEKTNGRNRQVFTERKANNKRT